MMTMQDLSDPAQCAVVYGPALAVGVAILKRIGGSVGAWIAGHPKTVAWILATAAAFLKTAWTKAPASASEWLAFATCVTATYAGSVATHETVLDPAAKLIGIPGATTTVPPKNGG